MKNNKINVTLVTIHFWGKGHVYENKMLNVAKYIATGVTEK